jgi:hypothetical protein
LFGKEGGSAVKCPDWIESWKEQYEEDADCEVLKADIKIVMKRENGEIVIRHSDYRSKNMPKIEIVHSPVYPCSDHGSTRRW